MTKGYSCTNECPSRSKIKILIDIKRPACVMIKRYFTFSSRCLVKLKKAKGKTISSQIWLARQLNDPYVRRAKSFDYRCRSAFKLIEIDERHHILQPGMSVVDCGAAPGSWSQVAVERVNSLNKDPKAKRGKVVSVDLKHFSPVDGATVLPYCDIKDDGTRSKILETLADEKADIILSDMAPNASGMRSLDVDNISELCFAVLVLADHVLRDGGVVLCKMWQSGSQQDQLLKAMKAKFETVKIVKPEASRKDSSEVFVLAREYCRQRRDTVEPQ